MRPCYKILSRKKQQYIIIFNCHLLFWISSLDSRLRQDLKDLFLFLIDRAGICYYFSVNFSCCPTWTEKVAVVIVINTITLTGY